MLTKQDWITSKIRKLCLTLLIFALVFVILAIYWTEGFEKLQVITYKLSLHPLSLTLEYETSLCSSPNIPIKPPSHNNISCPQKSIVTERHIRRLGNQIYEYISVWAIAKKTGHEPYVLSCMIQELGKIFQNLTVPPSHTLHFAP